MLKHGNLLCVDDDPIGLKVRKLLLEHFGFRVCTTTSGRDALALCRSRRFDAVVLDYQMPGMNGSQVARELRRMDPKIPILMLSAYPSPPESVTRAVNTFACKTEPITLLVAKIEGLLTLSRPDPVWWLGAALAIAALTGLAVQRVVRFGKAETALRAAFSKTA